MGLPVNDSIKKDPRWTQDGSLIIQDYETESLNHFRNVRNAITLFDSSAVSWFTHFHNCVVLGLHIYRGILLIKINKAFWKYIFVFQ